MQTRIAQLEDECQRLREENALLRNQLGLEPKSVPTTPPEPNAPIHTNIKTAQHNAKFLQLNI